MAPSVPQRLTLQQSDEAIIERWRPSEETPVIVPADSDGPRIDKRLGIATTEL
jgi:hypothetical protein